MVLCCLKPSNQNVRHLNNVHSRKEVFKVGPQLCGGRKRFTLRLVIVQKLAIQSVPKFGLPHRQLQNIQNSLPRPPQYVSSIEAVQRKPLNYQRGLYHLFLISSFVSPSTVLPDEPREDRSHKDVPKCE